MKRPRTHISVSVVLCASTDVQWPGVLAAANAVRGLTPRPAETYLVIDRNDDLARKARKCFPTGGSEVLVVHNVHSAGLAGARNTGLTLVLGDVVVFLDENSTPRTEWMAVLLGHFDDEDVVAVVAEHGTLAFRSKLLDAAGGFTEGDQSSVTATPDRLDNGLITRIGRHSGPLEILRRHPHELIRTAGEAAGAALHGTAEGHPPRAATSAAATDVDPTRRFVPLLLIGLGVIACAMAMLDLRGETAESIRLAAVGGFLLLGPGWAIAGFLRNVSTALLWCVASATGVGVGILISQLMLLLDVWSPVGALYIVVAICVPPLLRHAIVAA